LNFVSSDNDIKQNNRNNGIADDTGNRRELVHLHGTYFYNIVDNHIPENIFNHTMFPISPE